ncbi:MAG: FAD-dependent monooxygenase [Alphaproteobacteria bacterium]|nr:FAD-dependent monooxygenase [Alphaproteobacteria bacterium]
MTSKDLKAKDLRIAIIGGGIGGLTAALALQHFGFRVALFEQARELREIGAGVVISPNAMHALNFLGVGARVAQDAGPTELYVVRQYQTGEVLKTRWTGPEFFDSFGATYHQAHRGDLHSALAAAVMRNDPDCVFLDHRFETLTQDRDHVLATFANGKSHTSDILIGCDGGASRVRAAVFGDRQVNYTGQMAFRALMPIAKVPPRILQNAYAMHVGLNRALLHYPLRNRTIMNVVGLAREPKWQEEGWQIPATLDEFVALYSDFHPDALALIHAIEPGTLFKWGLRDREPLQQYTKGRVTMLGDAAHPMSPFLGQGACIAIEDALVLGRAFAAGGTFEEAFAIYENTRKERANGAQLASRQQADELQGVTERGANPGAHALTRGLYAYNPATVPLAAG